MPKRGRTAGNAGKGRNWISKRRRLALYARDGWCCRKCGVPVHCTIDRVPHGNRRGRQATLDHIRHRSNGGDDSDENLRTYCMPCNRHRGNAADAAA